MTRRIEEAVAGQPRLRARIAGGATCAAFVAVIVLPLLPRGAQGQTVPGGAALPISASPSAVCPTPVLADSTVTDPSGASTTTYAVTAISQPGEPPALGLHAGQKGTWVQLNGSNLSAPGCVPHVFVGGAEQNTPPTPDAANPTPAQNSSTSLTFQSTGVSGAVQVVLEDVAMQGANSSNANYTFLGQPTVSGVSPQDPQEGSSLTLTGTGFAIGGLPALLNAVYYSGATPDPGAICNVVGVQTTTVDTSIAVPAPTTYCSGTVSLAVAVQYDRQQDIAAPVNQGNVVYSAFTGSPLSIQVAAHISSLRPGRPQAGGEMVISGTGFGHAGSATLGGSALSVYSWTDRVIDLGVPTDAHTGALTLSRFDGTRFSAGQIALTPGVASSPTVLTGPDAVAPHPVMLGSGPPVATRPVVAPAPGSSAPFTGGQPKPGLLPMVASDAVTPPTPIGLSPFVVIAAAILVIAFVAGFVNAGLIILFARRSRRAAAAAAQAAVGQVSTVLRQPGRELRLGRHVRSVEVIGRATPLGHLLLRAGVIDRHTLRLALAQHRQERRPLGEVLVGRGAVSEEAVWHALGEQWGVSLADLDSHWVDPDVANRLTAADSIKYRVLALRAIGGSAIVAMANPFDARARLHVERCLGRAVVPILATPSALRRRQEEVYSAVLLDDSIASLQRLQPQASAHHLTTRGQRIFAAATAVLAVALAIIFGSAFFIGVAGGIVALYAIVVSFRIAVIVRGAKYQEVFQVSREELDALTDLPTYTILCPLYREAGVLPQLVEACAALDYPAPLLDVKLLLEADDAETLEAVRNYTLPPYFDVVVVPAEGPRTKPKACNYGLQFARGEYVVIFDAEDIPEPDQLKKAIATFRRSGPEVGCVQAKLNFYNPKQNILTGWFALEYTSWFDFFLPGLVDLGMPVPLGGSSNHFPTSLLRELNAWDPNNVTEDADLGMRLHRVGYRTVIMESTTYEEANSDFVNWVKQRSRWGKGYAVSWLVQMRHPRELLGAVGWKSFLAIQLTLGGTFGVALLNLAVWLLTLLWALAQFGFIAYLFPGVIYYVGMIELLFGNFFFLYMGVWSCQHRRSWDLTRISLLVPVYWLMMSLAMLKAALQLVTKPTYWEKTVHGLFDHAPEPVDEIELVGASGQPVAAKACGDPVGAGSAEEKQR